MAQAQQAPATQQAFAAPPSSGATGSSTKPNYDIFHNLDLMQSTPARQAITPAASAQSRAPASKPANDPFAALSSLTPRQGSPFPQYQQSTIPPPGRASLDKGPLPQLAQPPRASPISSARNSALVTEDEWTFSSSLPDQSTQEIALVNSSLHIVFHVSKAREADGAIKIKAAVSNNTTTPIADFTLQIAVMKVTHHVPPISSSSVATRLPEFPLPPPFFSKF